MRTAKWRRNKRHEKTMLFVLKETAMRYLYS